ncbi:hypothetical protein MCAP1_003235 [Malassezia caprae]|uniref:Uncharacterized protein n=1 Tax=Malassezia caprae TaxID=1381934 RepID=A0AAF0J1F7_9BASI|nr:hypothetical protein MCAP1_003235 [Malassezia caprae]
MSYYPMPPKCNAAGLAPEHSMVLPERTAREDESTIVDALAHATDGAAHMFAPDMIYSMPTGEVVVGRDAVLARWSMPQGAVLRLLETPASLPARAMVLDKVGAGAERSLLVLKRREHDGLVSSLTEEMGHRKPTVPLAARAATNVFSSPTDMMMSPCSSKLQLAKRRHHMKAKPTKLFADQMNSAASHT